MPEQEKEPVKYEEVTVKLPKEIVAFFKFFTEKQEFSSLEDCLAYVIADACRAQVDAAEAKDLMILFGLKEAFMQVLGDDCQIFYH